MSNRGKSLLKPTRNERDAIVQVWVDRKDLATIGTYMEEKGMTVLHMSDILKFSVETVRTIILKANGKYIDTTSEATKYLERFQINLNPRGKARKNLVTNLLSENGDLDSEFIEPPKEPLSIDRIAEIKRRASQQFMASGNSLLATREEKDTADIEAQKEVFKRLTEIKEVSDE